MKQPTAGWALGMGTRWWSEVLVWSMSQHPGIPVQPSSPCMAQAGSSLMVCPLLEPSCTIFQLLYDVEPVVREKERKKEKKSKPKQHYFLCPSSGFCLQKILASIMIRSLIE